MKPLFADPKTDVVFKKVFGQKEHKALLIDLLDSLLELEDSHRIADIEYLSPEQLPLRKDLKLSILDVKCTDQRGTRYVVEMQVIEVEGFQKRVVYNACKAYSAQLGASESYPALNDVIAVTICDFELWPERLEGGGHRVPMLSRWRNQEQHGGALGLGEVQYVFLELPKYSSGTKPTTTVEKWAYFFREARSLTRVPAELSGAPYAEALEVARAANLTEEEWTEYERERMAEQDYRGGIALAERRAAERAAAIAATNAQRQTLAQAILTVLGARSLPVADAVRERVLHTEDLATLHRWLSLAAVVASAEALLDTP